MSGRKSRALLRQVEEWARGHEEILALYLFGSEAAGIAGPLSDLDVAVLARFDIPKERLWQLDLQWLGDWDRSTTPRVDLQLLNLAPIPFRFEVITNGKLLWTGDPGAVADFESITRRRYWDLEPILERQWAAFVEQLEEGRSEAERRDYEAALERIRAVHRGVAQARSRDTRGARR